jgi:serine/threonine-protein kinase
LLDPAADGAWVDIAGGTFPMGSEDGHSDEKPVHDVTVSPFRIGRYPVTNLDYKAFVDAVGGRPPDHWSKGEIPDGKDDHPVVDVSWTDAVAFCAWLSERRKSEERGRADLPTEAQWEFAARGGQGRTYPWGDEEVTPEHANYDSEVGDTTPVDAYPKGATPEGVLDLAGNIWEWCRDGQRRYQADPISDPEGPDVGSRVLRGGCFVVLPELLRAASRYADPPGVRSGGVGFRVVWLSPGGQIP